MSDSRPFTEYVAIPRCFFDAAGKVDDVANNVRIVKTLTDKKFFMILIGLIVS
jgi:hypothetical protein